MRKATLFIMTGLLVAAGHGRAAAPAGPDTVSRVEYEQLKRDDEQLKKDQAELRKEVAELKRERQMSAQTAQPASAAPSNGQGAQPSPLPPGVTPATSEDVEELDKSIHGIKEQMRDFRLGSDKLVIAGDGAVGFMTQRDMKSSFSAGIAPLALFQPSDRILIEAAADIGISNDQNGSSSTSFDLTIADASFIVNDNLIIGGGLFVTPFGVYHRHFDPPWINKLPDDPLVFSDGGLAPSSVVGAFASGAIPIKLGNMKVLYDAYVSNGPNLETQDPGTAGQLHFDNYSDLNNNKAVGGRIALQPITELEFGYSAQFGKANSTGFHDVNATLQAVDFAYRKEFQQILGTVDVHGEWVWSDVSKATYDPTGALGFGPVRFSNNRNGGYILLAYRPTLVQNNVLRNTEYVVRFDAMTSPLRSPGGEHERRLELGVDYWFSPTAVLKFAYELDNKKTTHGEDAFFVQFGFGL